MAHQLHLHRAQHELRPSVPPSRVCACGRIAMPGTGRCDICAMRALDRLLELRRGELDEDES